MRPVAHVVHERGAPRMPGRLPNPAEEELYDLTAIVLFLPEPDERGGGGHEERRRQRNHGVILTRLGSVDCCRWCTIPTGFLPRTILAVSPGCTMSTRACVVCCGTLGSRLSATPV